MSEYVDLEDCVADLAFIGLGLSNTSTLIRLLEKLIEQPPRKPLRLLLLERHEVPFTGVAYGPRSGATALTISTLRDFVGPDMRRRFIAWVRANEGTLFKRFVAEGGELSARWLDKYRAANDQQLEDDLCMPRAFFGHYLQDQATTLLQRASDCGVVRTRLLEAEVSDIAGTRDGYTLELGGRHGNYHAHKVLLGIGAPVQSKLQLRSGEFADAREHIVSNLYERDIGTVCDDLAEYLRAQDADAPVNIMAIGANASAIEFCYLLFDRPGLKERIDKVFVMSPSARFPERRCIAELQPAFSPAALNRLKACDTIRAADIQSAVEADLADWHRRFDASEIPLASFNSEIIDLVRRLDPAEKKLFAEGVGVSIGREQRRAGDEYLDLVDAMVAEGRLVHVGGRFTRVVQTRNERHFIEYRSPGTSNPTVFGHPLTLVVNCMGSRPLHEQQSPLIDNLVRRGICQINDSGRGFVVDDHYAAAHNFIVTGPLIAGNVIGDMPVWHVEHCGRLAAIGETIGDRLHRETLDPQAMSVPVY